MPQDSCYPSRAMNLEPREYEGLCYALENHVLFELPLYYYYYYYYYYNNNILLLLLLLLLQ